jgi:hypothetical protein
VERPYWARLWVIQEIVLAASDVVMICGDQRIMWSTLRNGINMIGRYLYTTKNVLLDYERKKVGLRPMHAWDSLNFHHISRGIGGMTVWRQEEKESTVEQLLYVADRSLATDPKDKVYGLLGMLPTSLSERITPDYKLNTGAVFISVAKAFIQHYGNLEILREGRRWGNHVRPSWAPDWTAGFHGRESDLPRPYNAGDGKPAKFSFGEDGLQLTCSGYILDRIDGLGAQQDGYNWEWLPETIVQPSNRISIYGDFAATKIALYTALIGDRDISGAKAPGAHEAILNLLSDSTKAMEAFEKLGWTDMVLEGKYYEGFSNWIQANKSFFIHGISFGDYLTERIPEDADNKITREAYKRSGQVRLYRRFITTEKGYLGWAPDWQYVDDVSLPRKGDSICIIFGCSYPLIIGKRNNERVIIGEAYVQGMMEGEGFGMIKKGESKVQDFVLN